MSVLAVLGVGLVGGLGALARFLLDGAVTGRAGRGFPFGTLAVNLSGSLVLGIVAGAVLTDGANRIVATGFIGSFTTFSTWALETHRLGEDGRARLGALNVAVSLALGVAVAWLGRRIGGWW